MILLKTRNYEDKFLLSVFIIFFYLIFTALIIFLFFNKHFIYKNFTGVVSNKNVIFMVKDSDTKYFYHNATLFNDSKKRKFSISKVHKNILTKDNDKYHQIAINFKFSNNYKDNDALTISLRQKKERLIDIFKIIWKGE